MNDEQKDFAGEERRTETEHTQVSREEKKKRSQQRIHRLRDLAWSFTKSTWLMPVVYLLAVLCFALVGVQMFFPKPALLVLCTVAQILIQVFFTVEIAAKLWVERGSFFHQKYNIFDFIVVVASYLPHLRVALLLRVFHYVLLPSVDKDW